MLHLSGVRRMPPKFFFFKMAHDKVFGIRCNVPLQIYKPCNSRRTTDNSHSAASERMTHVLRIVEEDYTLLHV